MSGAGMGRGSLFTVNYVLIWIVNFVMVISAFPSMTILPLYLKASITEQTALVGFIIGVFACTALISRFVAGWALDNYSIGAIYRGSVLVFALFWFLYPLPQSPAVFIILRTLHGFVFGMTTISGSAAVVRIIPLPRRGEGLGYFGISLSVGMALGPFIAILLVESFSFHFYFIFLGVVNLAALGMLFLVKFVKRENHIVQPFSLQNIFLKKGFGLMINVFIINSVYGGIATFAALYAQELRLNSKLAAAFFLCTAFCMLLTRLFAGKIFDQKGPYKITVAGIIFMGAGSLSLVFTNGPVLYLAGGAFIGLGTGILFPVFQTMMNNLVHADKQGVANATYYVGLDMGWVAGSVVAGFIVGLTSITGANVFNVGLCAASLILFLAVNIKQYCRDKVA